MYRNKHLRKKQIAVSENNALHQGKDTEWLLSIPTEVRTEAVRDFTKAITAEKAKMKNTGRPFEMKFRSIKHLADQSIVMSKKCRPMERALLESLESERGSLRTLMKWDYDARLTVTRDGRYFIHLTREITVKSENQAPRYDNPLGGVISLDPGVRTFTTGYTPDGTMCEWGHQDVQRLERLQISMFQLTSQMNNYNDSTMNHRRRHNMKRAAARIQARITHLVDDLHWHCAKWLCENFRVIFLPKFEVSKMTCKSAVRRIGKRTVKNMLMLRHYTFRRRLLEKAREYPWVTVFLTNEACTTKTCTQCGTLNHFVGTAEVFRCVNPSCHFQWPRDWNGGRNIFLRQMGVLNVSPPSESLAEAENASVPLWPSTRYYPSPVDEQLVTKPKDNLKDKDIGVCSFN